MLWLMPLCAVKSCNNYSLANKKHLQLLPNDAIMLTWKDLPSPSIWTKWRRRFVAEPAARAKAAALRSATRANIAANKSTTKQLINIQKHPSSSPMRNNNLHIKQRKPTTQPQLRALLHALKLGECFYTRDKSVVRLANSLSRRTKLASGTRFSVNTLHDDSIMVQCVRHWWTNELMAAKKQPSSLCRRTTNQLHKMSKYADYRKLNDHSHNSSTYHKKDGTPVRAILKIETQKEVHQNLQTATSVACMLK